MPVDSEITWDAQAEAEGRVIHTDSGIFFVPADDAALTDDRGSRWTGNWMQLGYTEE